MPISGTFWTNMCTNTSAWGNSDARATHSFSTSAVLNHLSKHACLEPTCDYVNDRVKLTKQCNSCSFVDTACNIPQYGGKGFSAAVCQARMGCSFCAAGEMKCWKNTLEALNFRRNLLKVRNTYKSLLVESKPSKQNCVLGAELEKQFTHEVT